MSDKFKKLIEYFAKLPGIGPRQAMRLVLSLINWSGEEIDGFSQGIAELKNGVKFCLKCFNLANSELCSICQNPKRNNAKICVVEKVTEIEPIEKTNNFQGVYHVLGGAINPVDGITPEKLKIKELISRIAKLPNLKEAEIIIATNPNAYGETTALYLQESLKPFNIKITRLARGLSSGMQLEYADEITLQNALRNRK